MNARRKKPGARAVPARKAAPARRPATSSKASTKAATKARKTATTVLGAECTIEHAPTLHEQLAKVIADHACVTLDFSAVQRCDTAGLQLLAAFLRERREAGLDVELTGTSDNFMTTAGVLGLAAMFGPEGGHAEGGGA